MTISATPAPDGYSGDYRFFTNDETKRLWKARLTMRPARATMVESETELAVGEYCVCVSVSPCEADGSALREDGLPIVIDSHTHTFTNLEMSAPDFDAKAVIQGVVERCIEQGEGRLSGISAVRDIVSGWDK